MSRIIRAFVHYYNQNGKKTKSARRLFAHLCNKPDMLEIVLSGSCSIYITRKELKRALGAKPND